MATVMGCIRQYYADTDKLPPSLGELIPTYMEKSPADAWKRPIIFSLAADGSVTLLSLGEDGTPGGKGINSDISQHLRRATAADRSSEPWIQIQGTGFSTPTP